MGAYSPAPIINNLVEKKIVSKIIKPTILAMKKKEIHIMDFYTLV